MLHFLLHRDCQFNCHYIKKKMMRIVEERETSVQLPEIDLSMDSIKIPPRKKYGNLIVLFSCRNWTVTIGPQYYFFIPTFICFVAAGAFLTLFVNSIFTNIFFRIFNAGFSILQCGSYLFVALSNPGILFPDETYLQENTERQKIVCDKCGATHRSKRVRHCHYCNICVKGYDHHCPWVSKCIGANNYYFFSFFVGITPLYIMYYIIVLLVCLNFSLVAPASSNAS